MQGTAVWNERRAQNPERCIDLRGANLRGANLEETAELGAACFSQASAIRASRRGVEPPWAERSSLRGAHLYRAFLYEADLRGAKLSRSDLTGTILIQTNRPNTDLTGCFVYGISTWDLKLEGAKQRDLVITAGDQPQITVDNIEVGQFIYLLLHNEKISSVINTITSKVVLIFGRFTPERKVVLDTLREELRKHDYVPVLFDCDKPVSKDLTGTVSTLANMARFIIADLTDPSSIPHELATVIPNTVVPVQPVLLAGKNEYAMFIDFRRRYSWVLATHHYTSPEQLVSDLSERVIGPAEAKVRELRG